MFDPAAETMPRRDLAALQLARLKAIVARAYERVAPLRRKLDAAGVSPAHLSRARRHRAFPVHHQGRLARQLSVRPVRGAARGGAAPARLVRHHRQADGGRLHAGRSRPVVRPDGAHARLRRRAARRHRAQCLWLRPVHRRARLPLRRRAARLHRGADLGRRHRTSSCVDDRFRRPHPVRDAVLRPQHRRGREGHGRRSRGIAAAARHFRRRALERADAPRSRSARSASRRSTSTACRKSSAPASPANAAWRRTACTAGRTISCSR